MDTLLSPAVRRCAGPGRALRARATEDDAGLGRRPSFETVYRRERAGTGVAIWEAEDWEGIGRVVRADWCGEGGVLGIPWSLAVQKMTTHKPRRPSQSYLDAFDSLERKRYELSYDDRSA